VCVCVCVLVYEVCELMSSGVFAIFVTHTVSSLGTVRSYSSTFQMPVIMSRVAVNTSRALVSPATSSLHAALRAVSNAPAADPGSSTFWQAVFLHDKLTCNSTQNVCDLSCLRRLQVAQLWQRDRATHAPVT